MLDDNDLIGIDLIVASKNIRGMVGHYDELSARLRYSVYLLKEFFIRTRQYSMEGYDDLLFYLGEPFLKSLALASEESEFMLNEDQVNFIGPVKIGQQDPERVVIGYIEHVITHEII